MNKETIAAMLSSDSPAPINGEGRGGKPYFTKADAMYCVSGMPTDAWDYMQFVDVMLDEKFMQVSSRCGLELLTKHNIPAKEKNKIQHICEMALCEARTKPFSIQRRLELVRTSEATWYRKYSKYYALALAIYRRWDEQAGRYIEFKLGKIENNSK